MSSGTIRSLGALALMSLTFGVGCVMPAGPAATPPQNHAAAAPPPVAEAPAPVDAEAKREQENLAVVRDFLERTRELPPPSDPRPEAVVRAPNPVDTPPRPAPSPSTDTTGPLVTPSDQPERRALANGQLDLSPPARMPALPVVRTVSIRTAPVAAALPVEADTVVPGRVTNAPLELDRSFQLQSIDALLADWRTAAEGTSDADAQWRLTMLLLALGRDAEAAQVSANLPPQAQQILATFVPAAVAARAVVRNPMLVDDNQLAPVEQYARSLADLADPFVARIALCRRVVTFGVYDEQSPADFVAGRAVPTIVYSEIRNFSSQKTDGGYRTLLGTRLEVLTHDGKSVWEQSEPQIEDLSRTRRTDFFLAQRITLPATLAAGDYILKVYIEDKLSSRANESVRPFTVLEQSTVAARP